MKNQTLLLLVFCLCLTGISCTKKGEGPAPVSYSILRDTIIGETRTMVVLVDPRTTETELLDLGCWFRDRYSKESDNFGVTMYGDRSALPAGDALQGKEAFLGPWYKNVRSVVIKNKKSGIDYITIYKDGTAYKYNGADKKLIGTGNDARSQKN